MARAQSEAEHAADELVQRLARNPADLEAYRALHAHYGSVQDYASLTNLVSGLAEYTRDDPTAAASFAEAGQLAEQQLNDSRRAERYYRKALQRDASNLPASEALQTLLERDARWTDLRDWFGEQLLRLDQSGAKPSERAVLHYRLAELFSKQFDNAESALGHYRSAYELDPQLLRAIYEARQILLERGDLRGACLLYEREATAETDPGRRAHLLRELAECCQELEDEDGAVSALERARALTPEDMQLMHALASALVRRSAREGEQSRALDLDRVADLLCDIAGALPPADAHAFLVSALGHAPWHSRALYELERATPESARPGLAVHWVNFLAHNPDGDLANERRIALARAYQAAGQFEDAMFALQPAAEGGEVEALALLALLREQISPGAAEARPEREPSKPVIAEEPAPAPTASPARTPTGEATQALDSRDVELDSEARLPAAKRGEPTPAPQRTPDPGDSALTRPKQELPAAGPQRRRRPDSSRKLGTSSSEPAPAEVASQPPSPRDSATATADRALPVAPDPQPIAAAAEPPESRVRVSARPGGAAQTEAPAPIPSDEPSEVTANPGAEALDPAAFAMVGRDEERAPFDAEPTVVAPSNPPPPAVDDAEKLVDDADDAEESSVEAELIDDAEDLLAPYDESEPLPAAAIVDETALHELQASLEAAQREGDNERAFELAERIARMAPLDPVAFEVLDRHYRRNRDFRSRAELLLKTARNEGLESDLRKQRLREAIGLFEQKLLDFESALRAYAVLLELDPQNDDVLRGMARLLERLSRWDALCECLERSLALQTEASQKLALLRRLAELQRRERKDRAAAAHALTRLSELDPNDRAARVALSEDLSALGRWSELVQLLEQRVLQASGKSERVGLLRQLATLFEQKLDDSEAAFKIYERILELIPDDAQALTRMEEIDEASGAHERLLGTLNKRVERSNPTQAGSLLVRMATIAESDLSDAERAHTYLKSALERSPRNAQILTALTNFCERAGRLDELLALLRDRVESEKHGKTRSELQRRIARLLADRMNDSAGAAAAYSALNEQGDDLEAWTFLERHARTRDDAEALSQALHKLSELEEDPNVRRARLLERATLLGALGRPAEALEPLSRILLDIDADDSEARGRLEGLCEKLGDFRPLARVLEELLQHSESAGQSRESGEANANRGGLARDLARLYAQRMPDDARETRALTIWTEALADDPEPWRRLAEIYDRRRRYKELCEAQDALARLENTPAARATALLTAAELCWTRLKDESAMLARISNYVRSNPGSLPASLIDLARKAERLPELCVLCEASGHYDELFELLRERIAKSTDDTQKADLYRQLATLLIEERQDDDGALAAYEGLLALGEDVEALRFVQSWAVRHDDPERLAGALLRLAQAESNPEERRDLYMERGRILRTRLSRPREAIGAFEHVLAQSPEFWPAVDELIATSEEAGDHARLAAALERKLQNPDDPDDPIALLRRLTDLYEGPVADDLRAVDALRRWAELDSIGPEALRRLRLQYERRGEPRELLQTLDALSERERDATARLKATVAAAQLAFDKLADSDGALARLAPLVPFSDADADRALLQIAERAQRLPEVYGLLERAERYSDLVDQLERAARLEADPERKAVWLRRAARTLHEHLNEAERAATNYAELLTLVEDAEALRFMQARALEGDDPRALADALLRLSKLESDPRELRDVLYEYAHLQNYRLQDPNAALPVLRRILTEIDADFEPALDELISAAAASGESASLAFGLERALAREGDVSRRAELAERLSALYLDHLHDDEGAQHALASWIDAAPEELPPRRTLRGLLQKQGKHEQLLQCLDAIARRSELRDERTEAALAAARLCLGPLQDADQAFARLAELMLSGVPQAEDVLHTLAFESGKLDALCELYEQSQRYDELCALLRERAEAEPDRARRADLHLRCARVLAGTIGDEVAAAEAYREALALREDVEALRFLRGVAERQDDLDTLDDLLGRLAAVSDESERPALHFAHALLLRDRLDQSSAAIALLTPIVTRPAEDLDPALLSRAIDELERSALAIEDQSALAIALEARLSLLEDSSARRDTALRLADLYESVLPEADRERAAEALRRAAAADPRSLVARRRLKPHLERQAAWPEYVAALDQLSQLEPDPAERRSARLLAASAAYEKLGDAGSALMRLSSLLLGADAEAESLAQTVCKAGGQGRELAKLYVLRARQALNPADAQHSWYEAMLIHERWLDEPQEAFEASLRLLAADSHNRGYLDAVDRLAIRIGALERLVQVYAKLVRAAPGDVERIELCTRLSSLLEAQDDPQGALEFALQAARYAPNDAAAIGRLERLAEQQNSYGELLWAQERRANSTAQPEAASEAWLAAARTADLGLFDREQANACLRRALALTERAVESAPAVLETARELDQSRPELGKEDARRALLRAHLELAELSRGQFRIELTLRAAELARDELSDPGAGFDALRSGASMPPFADALLDALEQAALQLGRLDALDAQLSRSVERCEEVADKRRLLARRARVLTERLQRYDQAAQVYDRLLELSPDDPHATELLLACLRKAGRHRELLRACERRLIRLPDPQHKLPLLREMAQIWEVELKNRASALAIWNDVRAIAPQDEEASQAVSRLNGD